MFKIKKEINWGPALFLTIYQILLLISLPFFFYHWTPTASMFIASVILLYLTGLSITGGYHRFYAHKSYKTNSVVESILLFFGAMAGQGSALRWAFDHRIHHAHVDTDEDPYSINKGFWYAHFFWIFDKPQEISPKIVPDLLRNKLVMFQDRHIGKLMVVTNVMAFTFVGWLLNDYLGAFVVALWLRLFALHHFTWFINSLCHTWGDRPFSQEQSAVDNYLISLLTFGEGYHNYHHTFANDYRNGVRWFHFDPTKWLIWTLHKLGLAHSLKKMDPFTIRKRMVIEHRNLLLDQLKTAWLVKKEEIENQINQVSDHILVKIAKFNELKQAYSLNKQEKAPRNIMQELRTEIRALKKEIRNDWRSMKAIAREIMQHHTGPLQA